jgi:hypothetical protein
MHVAQQKTRAHILNRSSKTLEQLEIYFEHQIPPTIFPARIAMKKLRHLDIKYDDDDDPRLAR